MYHIQMAIPSLHYSAFFFSLNTSWRCFQIRTYRADLFTLMAAKNFIPGGTISYLNGFLIDIELFPFFIITNTAEGVSLNEHL